MAWSKTPFAGAVTAAALSLLTAPALASPGCIALQGTSTSNGLVALAAGFSAGDTISGTVTIPAGVGLFDVTTTLELVSPSTGFTYVVPANTNDTLAIISGTGPGGSVSWSCTNAPTASGTSNSQIIEQIRQTFSKVGAQTSSQAMGDATSDAISDAFSGTGTTQFGNGHVSFSSASIENADKRATTAKSDGQRAIDALAYNAPGSGFGANAMATKAPPLRVSPWHVWFDARFTGLDNHQATPFDGQHSNAMVGVSYRFTSNFLAGLLVSYENFRYSTEVAGTQATLRGDGVSGGAYFGWKFWDRLRLDGMMAYGGLHYSADSGPVSASFDAGRITGMARLSGRYGLGWAWVEPSTAVTLASEHQQSFIDTAGVFHDTFDFLVGRSSTGGTIGVPFVMPVGVVTPTLGAFADYRFGDQTTAAISSVPTFENGWSAHVNAGLNVAMPQGLAGSLGIEYGGLGQDLRYWRANARLGAKF